MAENAVFQPKQLKNSGLDSVEVQNFTKLAELCAEEVR
jgi:hypothetical protein